MYRVNTKGCGLRCENVFAAVGRWPFFLKNKSFPWNSFWGCWSCEASYICWTCTPQWGIHYWAGCSRLWLNWRCVFMGAFFLRAVRWISNHVPTSTSNWVGIDFFLKQPWGGFRLWIANESGRKCLAVKCFTAEMRSEMFSCKTLYSRNAVGNV